MANRSHAVSLKRAHEADHRRGSPLENRLNSKVLEIIRDREIIVEKDPGIEDEYEFEIFGDTGPTKPKKNKK